MKFTNIEEKIGQLFFTGIPSTEIDNVAEKLLRKVSPGGICLFSRNIREAEQTRRLNDSLRVILKNPIISVDQEGGLVDRLRRILTPMPAVKDLSCKGSVSDIEHYARMTAETLRVLGFNMNFAPVVDVIDENRDNFSNGLQSRAFGKSATEVIEMAEVYLRTLQEKGCLGSLKHFPGLGAIEVDSHDELPSVYFTEDEFFQIDLLPYKKLMDKGIVHAIMVGHAAFPNLNLQENDSAGKLLPASLSPNFVTSLLRGKLAFKGLILTDDLEMGAVLKNYPIGEICKKAIRAGVDMLLICASQDQIESGFDAVCEAYEKGEITENRISESLERIATFKKLLSDPLPFDTDRLSELSRNISELKTKLA